MALHPGDHLGPYEVVAALGAGGMGEVYRARDPRLGRDVAIKVLPATHSADSAFRERFDREARAIAALTHPNIVTIHSIEEHNGTRFLTMELVEGRPLHELIPSGGVPLTDFFRLAIPLTDAVAAAHQRGITHRDLKPANVMVSSDGRVKVLDFGLAKLTETSPGAGLVTSAPTEQLTGEGRILGTAAYMSPEQAEGKSVDQRTDIFSLGIIFFELATGRRPFQGDSTLSLLSSILRDTAPSVADVNVSYPREVGRLIRRCLEKDPARRLQSSLDLRNELEELRTELTAGTPGQLSSAAGLPPTHPPVSTAPASAVPLSVAPPATVPVRHRSSLRWSGAVAALLLAGGGYWALTVRDTAPSSALPVPGSADRSPATIGTFENRTGDPALNFVGQMLSEAIARELPQLALLERAAASATAPSNIPGRPRVTVSGSYYLVGDTLRLQASLADAAGALLYSIEPAIGPRAETAKVVDLAQDRVLGAIATFTDPADPAAALSRPPLYSALREMRPGYALYGVDNPGALKHFTRAAELDPQAFAAWEMIAYLHGDMDNRQAERETLERIAPLRERLTPFEQARLAVLTHLANNQPLDALKALREAERIAPQDLAINYLIGQAELHLNRPQATIDQYAKVRADAWNSSMLGGWRYSRLTAANHLLGRHDEELRIARTAKQLFATQLGTRNGELFALAALGRSDEIGRALDELVALQYSGGGSPGGSMRTAAEELRVHGHRESALVVARRAIDWYRARPPAQQATSRLALAQTLYQAEEWAAAGALVAELLKGGPDNQAYVALAGSVAARLGDRATALKHQAALMHLEKDPTATGALRRAQIAAVLGDRQQAVDLLRDALARGLDFDLALHRNVDLILLRGFAPYDALMAPK